MSLSARGGEAPRGRSGGEGSYAPPAPALGARPGPVARRSVWRQAARLGLAAVLPRRMLLVRGPRTGADLCLTFDDGPHPEHTPRLLDVLKQNGAAATFFVIGQRAESHPDLIRRMASEGHAVGNHSFSHGDPGRTGARQLDDEVRRTAQLLAGLLGHEPTLFRPPCGKLTAPKMLRLWRSRQTIVLWNADPKDMELRSAERILAWFRDRPPQAGDVILLHDDHAYAVDALPGIIAEARGRGLGFTTVSHWIR